MKLKLKTKYQRTIGASRQKEDFERMILEHLDKKGPESITRLTIIAKTNHGIVNRILTKLIRGGVIVRKSPEALGIVYYRQVRFLLAITPKGKQYLKKRRELKALMQWKDEAG